MVPASAASRQQLVAEHVVKRFAGGGGLDDVSVSVARGECLALVGESGAGKTTLLRCFNRLVTPDAGRILVDGRDVMTLDPIQLRRATGYVPQDGGLLPHWRLRRNVALVPWLESDPAADERADEALHLVGLDPERFGPRWPRELSGGERQRAALARALAARPHTVLLDEPFGALDAITRADLQDTFRTLRRELELTAVLVTHDIGEALALADKVAVLRQGRLEQVAPPDELVARPATEYVARLLDRARIRSAR